MSAKPTIGQLLNDHVTLTLHSLDRIYLNGYVPRLQTAGGLMGYFLGARKKAIVSPALLGQMTQEFNRAVEAFVRGQNIPVVAFERRERKDDVAQRMRRKDPRRGVVVFVGVAQEKQHAFKSGKAQKQGGRVDFCFSRQTVCVKHYYFYLDDEEFGPCFIKVGTYFPFPVRLCCNGHEWAKRQLEKEAIGYESLDNGFLSCEKPERLAEICRGLGPNQLKHLFERWVQRLPWPLSGADRRAGYHHELALWQLECSRTDVFERPVYGREFFEAVIRENIDLGRPSRMQLLFDRRIQKNTPSQFRTRVITAGVAPSLHVEYKHTGIKQYFKENRALRTETTINDARDFGIGRRLKNLPALAAIGHHTNARLLEVQRVSEDCILSPTSIQRLTQPTLTAQGQRAPGLRLADRRVMALLAALCLFLHLPEGFRNRQLRSHVAALLGENLQQYTAAKMSYDLRRLRLKGLIFRKAGSTRCYLTPYGLKVSLFLTRLHARLLRPGFAALEPENSSSIPHPLRAALHRVDEEIQHMLQNARFLAKAA
jgi:hypothetical protein